MNDLWDPPNYYPATEDTDSLSLCYDVIEETAINVQSCIQVLNILISKQDTVISELEDELMVLLSQLACTDVEFSDMVSMSLRMKIDFLDLSIGSLKDDAGDFLSTSRQPAESIHDIMKSLFCSYIQKKDQQFADNIRNVSSSCQVCAVNPSEKKKQTSSSFNANQLDKSKRVIINAISQTRVKTEENNNSIYPCMSPMSKYSAQGPFRSSLEKTNKCQKKPPIIITKNILQNNTPNCKSICQKLSLEKLKMVKSQPDDETLGPMSICLVKSSQEPVAKQKQNLTRDLVLFDGEPSRVSVSCKKYKRRQILNSQLMISSRSSPLLLEGPNLLLGHVNNKPYKMNCYTIPELRTIAKERQLTGYSKLKKVELAQLLGIQLIEGGKKPKKEEEKKGDTATSEDTGWAIAIVG